MLEDSTIEDRFSRVDARVVAAAREPDYYDSLSGSLAEAWSLLHRGAHDRRSPFHTPTVATVGLNGAPSVRTVVLRSVDNTQRLLRFNTDVRSTKHAEIEREPRLALHFYDARRKIQLRLDAVAELHGTDTIADVAWKVARPMSRVCYSAERAPGSVITDPTLSNNKAQNPIDAGRQNFCVVTARVMRIDWLYLAASGHRRACFDWDGDKLAATWLAP